MRENDGFASVQRARETRRLEGDGRPRSLTGPIFDPTARLQPMVMVIDDSMAVRSVVKIALSRQGISTITYSNGIEAIAALKQGEIAPPKIMLIDVGMPRMNGYDVARHLKSNRSFDGSRLFMLTGHDGVVNRTLAALLGAGFIAKPFQSPELVRIVCEALGMHAPEDRWR